MNKEEKAECLQMIRKVLSKWDKSEIIREMEYIHDVIDEESNINPQKPEKEYVLKKMLKNEETAWIYLFKILVCYEYSLRFDEVTNKFKNRESTDFIEDLYERLIKNGEEISLKYVADNYPLDVKYKQI